jgi:hypothetical protein
MVLTTSGRESRVSATGGSARTQADELDERQWRPRRGLALLVRFLSIGEQLHLDEDSRAKRHWAALVHDVGAVDACEAGAPERADRHLLGCGVTRR